MILVGPSGDVLGFYEISLGSSFVAVAERAEPCGVPAQQDISSHWPKPWQSSCFVRDVPAAVSPRGSSPALAATSGICARHGLCSASLALMTGSSMAQDIIQNIMYSMTRGFA